MEQSRTSWRVRNLALELQEPESLLRERAAEVIGVSEDRIVGLRIARKSVDARRRGSVRRIRFNIHVDLAVEGLPSGRSFEAARRGGRVVETPVVGSFRATGFRPDPIAHRRVVVVGSGPAGLFAARVLAENGIGVDLIDRGSALSRRGSDLVRFHRTRIPNPESNLLFGEGGAGTYSDGKLYTRVDDPLEIPCLEELVVCGAPPEILYDSRAHIGTDRLHRVLPRMLARMEERGVRFHWNTRMDALRVDRSARRVLGVHTSQGSLDCDALFVAPGHSARDTVRMLHASGVPICSKPFQLGVRIEHPQELITRGRYGEGAAATQLGPASYNLVSKLQPNAPSAHSFCMCPGGKIVASVHAAGELCTNGMSNSLHSSPFANAAIVTTFGSTDFGDGPFAGVAFQQELERAFFVAGGSDYTAPAQQADDFLAGRQTARPGRTSYTFGTCPGRIDRLLPEKARAAIAQGLRTFDRQIPGFAGPHGLLVGLESRSSGPLRILRDPERMTAEDWDNLYPIGEGAGYAGGIMSAAIDGARAAHAWILLLTGQNPD